MTLWVLIAVAVIGIVSFITFSGFGAAYRKYNAERLLTCPDNHATVVVRVDNIRAARTAVETGEPVVRLNRCTRWPEKADCDQACLQSLESAPKATAAEAFLIEYPQMIVGRHPITAPHHTIPPSIAVY